MIPTLRPLNVGEILDRAFSLYRGQFVPLLGTSFACYLPLAALSVLLGMVGTAGSLMLMMLAAYVVLVLAVGSLTYQASRAYMGHPATPGESLRHGLVRLVPLAVAIILTGIAIGLGFLGLIVGALIVWVLLFAVVPAVIIERRGPIEALQRSADLAEGDWWRIFLVLLVAWLIAGLPPMVFEAMMRSAGDATDPMYAGLTQAVTALVNALTYPFSVTVTVILYYDRRVRAEGLDVELMAAAAAA